MSPEQHKDYLSVVYNEKDRPYTEYPKKLAQYLVNRCGLSAGMKILDLGCGRGEFLGGFIQCGLEGYGVDQSTTANSCCPDGCILRADIAPGSLPFKPQSFDIVFFKSLLEHFYYPEKVVREVHRILKNDGLAITMVPDWESVYKTFYNDYTHRTPFTVLSLRDIFLIYDFDPVTVEKFRQLPFLWKMPWLQPFTVLLSMFTPRKLRSYSKLIKFSQEIMLLAIAVKKRRLSE